MQFHLELYFFRNHYNSRNSPIKGNCLKYTFPRYKCIFFCFNRNILNTCMFTGNIWFKGDFIGFRWFAFTPAHSHFNTATKLFTISYLLSQQTVFYINKELIIIKNRHSISGICAYLSPTREVIRVFSKILARGIRGRCSINKAFEHKARVLTVQR